MKEIATHSSILAWEIPWTEELGGLQSMGSQKCQATKQLDGHFLFEFCFLCAEKIKNSQGKAGCSWITPGFLPCGALVAFQHLYIVVVYIFPEFIIVTSRLGESDTSFCAII